MSKTLELKYDVGDTAYAMLENTPSKVRVINFNLDWNKKLPIEDRLRYEVVRHRSDSEGLALTVNSYVFGNQYLNTYKTLDDIFDTKEALIESLTSKIQEL